MTKTSGLVALGVAILLAIGANTYVSLTDHGDLSGFVKAESVQRVHTIGERCEATEHQATVLHNRLPASAKHEADWFDASYQRCLESLAKVEARAGVKYRP